MRKPQSPPNFYELFSNLLESNPKRLPEIFSKIHEQAHPYLHWDKLRYLKPPGEISHEEWWLALKYERSTISKRVPLLDVNGKPFIYASADPIAEHLHEIDLSIGGRIQMPEQITNPETRDQYYVESLIEEAITSSQLEGATTIRNVAKNMIRAGRKPSDLSEQMIFNNYLTMKTIADLKHKPLTKELVFELHRRITTDTLEDPDSAGRFRHSDEEIVVADDDGETFHVPPAAEELDKRISLMCDFANQKSPKEFLHPVLRAIMLHFWLAYDHPFVDGNGRTARALFYWAMLRYGYWLCEYLSISTIILKGPSKYSRAFLYTESDDNDLTYFLIYHLEVLNHSVKALQKYIRRQVKTLQDVEAQIKNVSVLNHRQRALVAHALRHPRARYTFRGHQTSHQVTYQTARTDLLNLVENGLFGSRKVKRQWYFTPIDSLKKALSNLDDLEKL